MAGSITKVGQWKLYMKLMSSARFANKLKSEVKKATTANTLLVRTEIITRIDQGKYEPNRPITIAMKGSSLPLVDRGDLRRSIRTRQIDWSSGFVGVLAATKLRGKAMANIGEMLHEGFTIKITPKMRTWFKYKAKEYVFSPINPSTSALRVRGRPFIKQPFEDPKIQTDCEDNWRMAVDAAFNDLSPKYKVAP